MMPADEGITALVALYWLPLGAGDALPIVRWNGRIYEAIVSRRDGRPRCDIYHAALQVMADGARFVIEVAPVWSGGRADRGVVREGPVGFPWLGASRFFRYEVRCWRDGVIPDARHAVGGPRTLTTDPAASRAVLDLVADVPVATWGRDEFGVGDMWNSNSVIAWLLVRSGLEGQHTEPPARGRAPGWNAGRVVATR
jgi:hypothetical protein